MIAGSNATSKEVEIAGFKWFAFIIAVIFVVFITITCVNIKEKATVDMQSPSVKQMFKALISNDQAMTIVLTIVLINMAIYTTSNLVIYFFKYDFGGAGWQGSYTLFNTFGGGIQILAMMVMYPILRKFQSNIRIFYICLVSAVAGYVILFGLTFLNMSNVMVLFVPAFFIFSANGVLNVLTTVFLANTVDYGDLKNNRRDESVIFSMQTFVVKLGSGISALIASIALSITNLKEAAGETANQEFDFSKTVSDSSRFGLRMTMTIIPVIGLIIAVIVFKKKFILTEKKMDEITIELSQRNKAAESKQQSE